MDLLLEYEKGSSNSWAGEADGGRQTLQRAVDELEAAVSLKEGYGWGVNFGA